MIDSRVTTVVARAKPREEVTLIVSFTARPNLQDIKRMRDAHSRKQAIERFYTASKEPLISAVRSKSEDGFRIVSELGGTHQVIISAPATSWKRVLQNPQSVFAGQNIRLATNEPAFSLP